MVGKKVKVTDEKMQERLKDLKVQAFEIRDQHDMVMARGSELKQLYSKIINEIVAIKKKSAKPGKG